jgi:hypothetical protein
VLHFELSEVRAEAGCLEAALEFTDFADIAQTRETQVEAFGPDSFQVPADGVGTAKRQN